MKSTTLLLIAIVALAILGAIAMWSTMQSTMQSTISTESATAVGETQRVRTLVTNFGDRLNDVSLLAPEKVLRQQIHEAYAPFVSDELLAAWIDEPATAPGRLTSSPWPDGIEVTSIGKTAGKYTVVGTIVLMTSVEMASSEDDTAGNRPVTVTVANLDGAWVVTGLDMPSTEGAADKTYSSPENGFSIHYSSDTFAVLGTGREDAAHKGHNIPPCADGFAACVVHRADTYAGTNLDSAGVGIFITDAASRQACETTKYGTIRRNAHAETINGQVFTVFESGSAAMSHVARDIVYLTWRGNSCYQLVSRIATSRFEVYEPGSIEEFTEAATSRLREDLRAIVSTFGP